jgi:hypothetical protein
MTPKRQAVEKLWTDRGKPVDPWCMKINLLARLHRIGAVRTFFRL